MEKDIEKKGIYISDYTGDDTIPAFVTFCIEQYKHYKKISGEKAMKLLSDAGILEYLAKHYDTLHLESKQWILNDLDQLVNSKILIK